MSLLLVTIVLSLTACSPEKKKPSAPDVIIAPQGFNKTASLTASNTEFPCPYLAPFTQRLTFPSRYEGSGAARNVVNPRAEAEYQSMTRQINRFGQQLTQLANRLYRGDGNRQTLQCFTDQLFNWASANAMLNVANQTGVAVRKWNLATYASNLLKVKNTLVAQQDSHINAQLETIEKWLAALAWQVKADYSDREEKKVNNHDYWAAWSVIAVATLVNDHTLFDWSESVFQKGINRISEQGFITSELKRESLAAQYQNFAIAPLVATAAFLHANQRLSPLALDKLDLAANQVLRTLESTEAFEQQTGFAQKDPKAATRGRLAWLPIWITLKTSTEAEAILNEYKIDGTSRLGGDTFALYDQR